MTKIAKASRESDERTLEWLRLLRAGLPITEVAQRFNVSRATVSEARNRVRDDDLARSGEPHDVVRAAYA